MATEGPLYVDGAQCQAAANYFNPVTTLYGPFGSGQFLAVVISAARTVALATVATSPIYGILQNTPDIGQAASVALAPSITKAVSGAAFSAGALLMVSAAQPGCLIVWAAGAHNYVVGTALEAAGAANAVVTVALQGNYLGIT